MCKWIEEVHEYLYIDYFYNDVCTLQGPGALQVRVLHNESHSLCGYLGKILVNARHEQVKTVVMEEAPS